MNFTSTFTNIDCSQAHDVVGNKSFDNDLQSSHSNLTDSLLTQASSPVSPLTYIAFGLVCAIVILGLCGNLLTLAITLKFRNALKGHDVLIIALVLCDCAALVMTSLIHPSTYDVFGTDVTAISTIGCKLFIGVRISVMVSSSVVIVLISIERFVAVWFPLRSRYLLSRKTIFRSVCVSVVLSFLVFVTLCILYCEIQDGLCYPKYRVD